jgi:hypothetical protein
VKIGLNGSNHTIERVIGYLNKCSDSSKGGASENQSEQHFKNHRAWSLVAAKRVGIVLGRKNLFEFLWRMFSAQDLKFLWSFLTVPQEFESP